MNRQISSSCGGINESLLHSGVERRKQFWSEPQISDLGKAAGLGLNKRRPTRSKPKLVVNNRRTSRVKTRNRRRRKVGRNLSDAEIYADIFKKISTMNYEQKKPAAKACVDIQRDRRKDSIPAHCHHKVLGESGSWSPFTRRADYSHDTPHLFSDADKRQSRSLKMKRWVEEQNFNKSWLENEKGVKKVFFGGSQDRYPLVVAKAAAHFKELGKNRFNPNSKGINIGKISTAAAKRRQQWISHFTSTSISSEDTCDDFSIEDIELKSHSEIFDALETPTIIKERRLTAIKDKLNSKGQSFEVIELLSAKKEKELLEFIHARHAKVILDVCLLWSCINGDKNIISYFLKLGANPEASDAEGFSAMHLIAENGNGESVDTLFLAGARVTGPVIWDNKREFTPLMLAARSGNVGTIDALISRGADVNTNINSSKDMALHFAVRNKHTECVQSLVNAKALLNPLTLYSETPLHIAVTEEFTDIVTILLEAGADVRASKGISRMASLHLAAQEGNHIITSMLLKAGADVKQINARGQTALHIAARAQSADTVQKLLKSGANPNAKDYDGKIPLHSGIFKGSRCFECLKLLIESNANPNAADIAGYTPLHLAALNDSSYCVQMFLKNGADVSARTKGGISALNIILRKTPLGLTCLQEILDSAILQEDRDHHREGDFQMQLDYRLFKGENGNEPECRLLTCFIKERQRLLLKHPLCESFIYLKWQQVRSFFFVNIIFYAMLVIALTVFIHHTFPGTCFCEILIFKQTNSSDPICPSSKTTPHYQHSAGNDTSDQKAENDINPLKYFLTYFIWILVCLLSFKEFIQFVDTPRTYIASLDNLLIWPIISFSFLITISGYLNTDRSEWEYHIAAYLILLSWVELLLLVGRFPLCGLYVQMFARVIQNFSKFVLTYVCLINAFSLSFGVLFHNHSAFKCHLLRLLKTLVMMTGEVEYDDFFFDAPDILYPGTAHFIFALFLLFCTIILMNLLVGLAVSDIQGLQQSAGLDRLVRQTELIASLELILFSRWLSITFPPSVLKIIRQRVLLLPTMYGSKFTLAAKTINGFKLDNELLASIYRIARAKDHGSKRRNAFASFRSMSHAAQYGSEGEIGRGIEAVHCGLELLVRESEARKSEAKQMKESLITILHQLEELLLRTTKLELEKSEEADDMDEQ